MAKPGPAPTPTVIKKMRGNPGGRPLNEKEPKPVQTKVKRMPRGLSNDAKKLWRTLATTLIDWGVLTDWDIPAFMLMAEHYAIAMQASRIITEEGLQTIDEHKCQRKHPLLQVMRDSSTAFRLYASEFGLTPSSRSRLSVQPPAEELGLKDLLFQAIVEVNDEVLG